MTNPFEIKHPLPPITSLHMAVTEIELALKNQLYYLALIGTLSLIDLCAALESEKAKIDKHDYIKWYDTYLGPHYPWLTGIDCYGLRCGVIHKGGMDHKVTTHKGAPMPTEWRRIVFVLTDVVGMQI